MNIILFSTCQKRSHKHLIMLLSISLTNSMTHKMNPNNKWSSKEKFYINCEV